MLFMCFFNYVFIDGGHLIILIKVIIKLKADVFQTVERIGVE